MNRLTQISIFGGILSLLALGTAKPASAQLLPQAWGSIGYNDDVTYSVGARFLNYGAELGFDGDGNVGGDVLAFVPVPLPLVSPYVGLGYYGGSREDVAFSFGAQVRPRGENIFFGAGYNTVRGVNGQLGVKF